VFHPQYQHGLSVDFSLGYAWISSTQMLAFRVPKFADLPREFELVRVDVRRHRISEDTRLNQWIRSYAPYIGHVIRLEYNPSRRLALLAVHGYTLVFSTERAGYRQVYPASEGHDCCWLSNRSWMDATMLYLSRKLRLHVVRLDGLSRPISKAVQARLYAGRQWQSDYLASGRTRNSFTTFYANDGPGHETRLFIRSLKLDRLLDRVRRYSIALPHPAQYISAVAISPDHAHVAVATDTSLWVLGMRSRVWRKIAIPKRHDTWLSKVAWLPDGKSISFEFADDLWTTRSGL
jgi:hypothetical protein